jgi:8-oxo-dGTP pyrophosphatase MutT (NUDIX family)
VSTDHLRQNVEPSRRGDSARSALLRAASAGVSGQEQQNVSAYGGPVALRLREAVRAVVVDDDDWVLLVRFDFEDGTLWATPGGGVNDGESIDDTVRRELNEEVGLQGLELGPIIWQRTHVFPLSADFDGQREVFFLIRVRTTPGRPLFSPDELRAEGLGGSRWWTVAELRAATDTRFAPRCLPHLYSRLVLGGPLSEVIDTGV